MSQNTGSWVEAHLQVDNQQQVLFLWFLVDLNIRRWEGISNVLNLKREGRNCEILWIEGLLCARTLCWVLRMRKVLALRVYDLNRRTGR